MSKINLKRAWYVDGKAIYIFSRNQRSGVSNDYDNQLWQDAIDIECDTKLLAEVRMKHPEVKEIHMGYGFCEPMSTPKQVFQLARDIRKVDAGTPIYLHCPTYNWARLNKVNNFLVYLSAMAELGNVYLECADEKELKDLNKEFFMG